MLKQSTANLSKLSRGICEKKGETIQVFYDNQDLTELQFSGILNGQANDYLNETGVEHRLLSLPKTFSSKKGPLILFSEETLTQAEFHDELTISSHRTTSINNSNLINDNIKSSITCGDLRRSILEFPSIEDQMMMEEHNASMHRLERENTLEHLNILKDYKFLSKNDQTIEKIRPGFSAKRYLSSWTKRWEPNLFETLSKEGHIKVENLFEPNEIMPNLKHRIDDDLSKIPPAYRISKNWLTINFAPLKGYRFYRIHKDYLGINTRENGDFNTDTPDGIIQVVDKDGKDVQYNDLSKKDKEIVLTELLLQSAIQSIAENQIEMIENVLRTSNTKSNEYSKQDDKHQQHNENELKQEDFQTSFFYDNVNGMNLEKKLAVKQFNPYDIISKPSNDESKYLFRKFNGNKLHSFSTKRSIDLTNTSFLQQVPPIKQYVSFHKTGYKHANSSTHSEHLSFDHSKASFVFDYRRSSDKVDESSNNDEIQRRVKFKDIDEEPAKNAHLKATSKSSMEHNKSSTSFLPPIGDHNTENFESEKLNITKHGDNINNNSEQFTNRTDNKKNLKEAHEKDTKQLYHPSSVRFEQNINEVIVKPNNTHQLIRRASIDKKPPTIIKPAKNGVMIMAPDGEIIKIGKQLFNLDAESNKTKKKSEITYRLSDKSETHFSNQDTNEKYSKTIDLDLSSDEDKPILSDEIIQELARHAQEMAKAALESSDSGRDLIDDVQMALNENFKKIKNAYRSGAMNTSDFENFSRIMKDTLKKSLNDLFLESNELSAIEINDSLLENLLEFPANAFEIVTSNNSHKKLIQVKKSFLERKLSETFQNIPPAVNEQTNHLLDQKLSNSPNLNSFSQIRIDKSFDDDDNDADDDKDDDEKVNLNVSHVINDHKVDETNLPLDSILNAVSPNEETNDNIQNQDELIKLETINTPNTANNVDNNEINKSLNKQINVSKVNLESNSQSKLNESLIINDLNDEMNKFKTPNIRYQANGPPPKSDLSSRKPKVNEEKVENVKITYQSMNKGPKSEPLRLSDTDPTNQATTKAIGKLPKPPKPQGMVAEEKVTAKQQVEVEPTEVKSTAKKAKKGPKSKRDKSKDAEENKTDEEKVEEQKEKTKKKKKEKVKPEVFKFGGIKEEIIKGLEPELPKNERKKSKTSDTMKTDEEPKGKTKTKTKKPKSKEDMKPTSKKSQRGDTKNQEEKLEKEMSFNVEFMARKEEPHKNKDEEKLDEPNAQEPPPINPATTQPPKFQVAELTEKDFEGVDINVLSQQQINEALMNKFADASDVREFRRRQAAEQKRIEAERIRKEREEKRRRDEEEALKREKLAKEIEEEQRRKEEELRLKRQAERLKRKREEQKLAEEEERQRQQAELEKKAREDYNRKMEEMRLKLIAELALKAKLEEERRLEEEKRRRHEEYLITTMNEAEKEEFLRMRREEEEKERLRLEEESRLREEALNKAIEEAKRIAAEEARKKAEYELKMQFARSIREESIRLQNSHSITRAFVFSYYDILRFLGIEPPANLRPH